MGTEESAHFHQSGQSVALVSPSIFQEGLGRLIRGLLPPPWGVLQVCQTPLRLTGRLRRLAGRVLGVDGFRGMRWHATPVTVFTVQPDVKLLHTLA